MAIFKGFKPQAMQKIAGRLGYMGSMADFDNYLEQNPEKKRQMIVFQEAAKEMARGGVVKMQEGGTPEPNPIETPAPTEAPASDAGNIGEVSVDRMFNPTLPTGGTVTPFGVPTEQGQMVSPVAGQVSGTVSVPTAMGTTNMANQPVAGQANLMDAQSVAEQVNTTQSS